MDLEGTDMAAHSPNQILSEFYYSLYASFVPLYSDLLGICPAGFIEARAYKGACIGCLEGLEM